MKMDLKSLIEALNAALTPLIAIIATYIAYQQYRVNQNKLSHELYDRRLKVFKSVMAFYSEIMRQGTIRYPLLTQFYADSGEAEFLYGEEITSHIDTLYRKDIKLAYLNEQMYPSSGDPGLPVGDQRTQVSQEHSQLVGWFIDELPKTKVMFRKYLMVS